MRAALPVKLALPFALPIALWACGTSSTEATPDAQSTRPDAELADAGVVNADATANADAAPSGEDATVGGEDARVAMDAGFAPDAEAPDAGTTACTYPQATEPMMLDRALSPYSWADAIDPAGTHRSLALADVHCNTQADIDWSAFEHLLFVSMPAW